jgi:hypothetical protein
MYFFIGMEMQVDDPNFLSNILEEVEAGAGLEDMDIGLTQDTQPHDELQVSRSTKPGAAKRKKNFHWQEDEIICSGWLNVSKDPIHGANQTRSSFWGRIHAYYEEHKETPDERTVSSIMHRWLTIQLQVNKFCSCYEAILRRNQSGLTIDDKAMFISLQNAKSFQDSPSHRICRHIYEALNVGKKIINCTVYL